MAFGKVTQVELNCGGDDSWNTASKTTAAEGEDLISSLVPANTSALILHVDVSGMADNFGIRKPGSTDNRNNVHPIGSHFWCMVGVDSSKNFEVWIGNTAIKVYLEGYATSDSVVWFTNAHNDRTPTPDGTWREVNVNDICPNAIGIIYEYSGSVGGWLYGARKKGSSDNRTIPDGYKDYAVIGCDNSQIFEFFHDEVGGDSNTLYILGYIVSGAVFNTNGVDKSLGATGAYIDINAGTTNALFQVIECVSSQANVDYALREDGKSNDIYKHLTGQHNWALVPASAGIVEGKIESTGIDFFLLGYFGITKPRSQGYIMS